jgi:cell fate regulator YaaT (PSP1 superfamily)
MVIRFLIDLIDAFIQHRRQEDIKAHIQDRVEEHLKNIKIFNCTCEVHEETVYLFDDDDNFIAQGRNLQELKDHLEKRFKQYMINLTADANLPAWLKKEKAFSNGSN